MSNKKELDYQAARHHKRTGSDIAFNIINYTVFTILAFLCAYPFYYLIINSISSNELSNNGLINFLPRQIHLQNYRDAFSLPGLSTAMVISILRTVIGTVLTVLASALLGYMFTLRRMWHRQFFYRFVVITMYFNAGLIPMFMTMKLLHLTNNFLVYILPLIVQPFYIIMVKTFIENTPVSLQEAAEIDGAGPITIFMKIILPISTPILATVAIWAAVGQWNSFQDTLIYVTDQKLYTLQYLLYIYINQANSLAASVKSSGNIANVQNLITRQTPTSIRMTVSVIVVLPILFVYPIFQRYFVKGIMIGAVKG
jgi:multiple sugar transport system permease protein/putative aldouronate transport system permease protein